VSRSRRKAALMAVIAAVLGGLAVGPVAAAQAAPLAPSALRTAATAAPAEAAAPAFTGRWGNTQLLSGVAALGAGAAWDFVSAVSCGATGYCVAGGVFGGNGTGTYNKGFLAEERHGVWGKAFQPAGLAALNKGNDGGVGGLSCPSAENCLAYGSYQADPDNGNSGQAFIVTESKGAWSAAEELPGLGALAGAVSTSIGGADCRSAGNCAIVGGYSDAAGDNYLFDDLETGGVWGTPQEIAGIAALDVSNLTIAQAVSCGKAGNCAAGGVYYDAKNDGKAFMVSEQAGKWTAAQAIPLPSKSAFNLFDAVDCPPAGPCVAAFDDDGTQAFQAVEQPAGTWGKASAIAGVSQVKGLACPEAGYCTVGGGGTAKTPGAVVATETKGTWANASVLPGKLRMDGVLALACAAVGQCSALGSYEIPAAPVANSSSFVASETNGKWSAGITVPGLKAQFSSLQVIDCTAPLACVAGGDEEGKNAGTSGFVVSENPIRTTVTALKLSAVKLTYGKEQAEKITVTVKPVTGAAVPAAKVSVKSGSKDICTITVKSGGGACALTAKQLAAGTYHLAAAYPGTAAIAASASAAVTLTVNQP
jgi:hypothetical protein